MTAIAISHRSDTILNQTQVDSFNESGFLKLTSIIDEVEINQLRAKLMRLFDDKTGREEGAYYDLVGRDEEGKEPQLPQIKDPLNFVPSIRKMPFMHIVDAVAKQLLGMNATLANDHAILKPASYGQATPWHQDEAYRANPKYDFQEISFWIALQKTTLENGCMHYCAGSHRRPVMTHQSANNDPRIHALECSNEIDGSRVVACPVAVGDIIVHHTRTAHYAGPNITEKPRLAYILIYEAPPHLAKEKREISWHSRRPTAAEARRRMWLIKGGFATVIGRKLARIWRNPQRYINKLKRV